MARPPRQSGSGNAAPPPAESAASASAVAEARRPLEAAVVARPKIATTPAPPTTSAYMAPPQGPGAPQQMRHDGSPSSEERLNSAMKILLDPAARALPSKVYSGQTRNWTRRS
ncbi:hypothetical protein [Bradyrhizobium sp. CER78]|uniref:hypothetical protein n=1 Tax=Bradyrhizobium sp. CER78 TaxID=3039162 RepID=UPI0024482B12|nr:hypothetical protein [Bradyrhizobium sp. CER78]MDH2387010.1 hypothetical protein [Bradyrhizobium sp. CER78]